jgi:hypothetical protein
VAAQRGHIIPEAPHTSAAGHRDMARLPRKQNRAPALRGPRHPGPSTRPGYARAPRHLRASDARRRAETKWSTVAHPWDARSGHGSATAHRPFLWRRPPRPRSPGAASGGGAPTWALRSRREQRSRICIDGIAPTRCTYASEISRITKHIGNQKNGKRRRQRQGGAAAAAAAKTQATQAAAGGGRCHEPPRRDLRSRLQHK